MRTRTLLFLPVGLLAIAALCSCGVKEGGACTGEGYRCEDRSTVLECRDGHWLALPCSGPQGCAVSGGGVTCDISLNQEGDGCPTALEGTGFCRDTPPSLFACRNLTLVKIQNCSSCTVGAGNIVCNP
ncbi:MAG TPA: hypothetical protein VND93_08775 [Myxococcales bacterium]|jgi:hypothetical protein|nr:hypothetical protein [Myxococcales bacterium]